MQRRCSGCGIIIQTGERVAAEIEFTYREIPSKVMVAARKNWIEIDSTKLRHVRCPARGMED